MVLKDGIYFKEARTYVDIVFHPIPLKLNEIAMGEGAMSL